MKVAGWNMVSWDIGPSWNGVTGAPSPVSLPSPPLRLRECIRRVGVHNETARQESLAVNREAKVFFEFGGISGLDTINPKDFDC